MTEPIRFPVPVLLASVYLTGIVIGALLLKLPFASVSSVSWSDAFFTATSAVTVTGLGVIDMGRELTFFGQAILLILIQLGGLGLMTSAVILLSSLGLQIDIVQVSILRGEIGGTSFGGLLRLAWTVFRIVLVCEGLGFAILASGFVPLYGWPDGLWLALFHSISAFNNAGFSPLEAGLAEVGGRPVITLTMSVLFVIGGLGFAVLSDMLNRRGWSSYTLHTRMMLTGTAALVVLSLVVYASLEWNNPDTLGAIDSPWIRSSILWFEALTPRTAGFNIVDTADIHSATSLFVMFLMVIGAGSTSTAGGIKVTSAFVLVLATMAFFKTSGRMQAFGYSLGPDQGMKVMAVLSLSMTIIVVCLFFILATHDLDLHDALFEVVSAFGTVGLTRGVTGELNDFGRLLIAITMFLGRIGPLTLGFFLAAKTPPVVRYPEGSVYLG